MPDLPTLVVHPRDTRVPARVRVASSSPSPSLDPGAGDSLPRRHDVFGVFVHVFVVVARVERRYGSGARLEARLLLLPVHLVRQG